MARLLKVALVAALVLVPIALLLPFLAAVAVLSANACRPGSQVDMSAVPQTVAGGASIGVTVASWNTYAANSLSNVIEGLRSLSAKADVIGVQELTPESRRNAVQRVLRGFGISRGNNAVQILWRADRLELLAQGSVKVFDVTRIEGGVSGTSIGPKSVQWVQLRQRSSGAAFFVLNHHIVPSIERGGRPDRSKPRRIELYTKQMTALLSLVKRFRVISPVIVTGDFNTDARADARVQDPAWPQAVMARSGLQSNWRVLGASPGQATHGHRLIDYVWATSSARPTSQQIGSRFGSDHASLIVVFGGSPAARQGQSNSPLANIQVPPSTVAIPRVKGLSARQMQVARTVYLTTLEVGRQEGWSAAAIDHAAVIALSTAMKESTMLADPRSKRPDQNVDMGLFGQRTLPGWYGTPKQVLDPAYGTRTFLLGHRVTAAAVAAAHRNGTEPAGSAGYVIPGLKQVDGWMGLPVGVASHRVQRSAFPNMPERLQQIGQNLVTVLKKVVSHTSVSAAAIGVENPDCVAEAPDVTGGALDCKATEMPGERGLTPDALLALRCVAAKFPQIKDIGGIYETNAGDHPSGRAIDVMVPNYQSPDGIALGTSVAIWAREHQRELGITYVVWRERIWNTARDSEDWRQCGTAAARCYAGPDDSASHRNHVHISVSGHDATGFAKAAAIGPIDTGPCPLDRMYTGEKPGRDCNQALAFFEAQVRSPTQNWYRQCMALVARSYDFAGGAPTAFVAAQRVQRAGRMFTDRDNIPRGAVMWWDGSATGSNAGHVAVYDGQGHVFSSDAPHSGKVGRVPWTFIEDEWGHRWMGWSPPGTWGDPS